MIPYSIVLADDHAMFRQGIKMIIEEVKDLEVVGEANDGQELMVLLKKVNPHLVILDISMPNLWGLEAAREIKALHPQVKILLLTMHKNKDFLQAGVEAGVEGFLLKEDAATELLQAVEAIRRGEKFFSSLLSGQLADLVLDSGKADHLTRREKEIVKFLAESKNIKEIAELLCISIYTVRRHRNNIMHKLGLKGLADLVRYAIEHGLAQPAARG